jgi:hypothetical protein
MKCHLENNQIKMDWRHGSSDRVPALQMLSPEFKPQYHYTTKKKKKKKKKAQNKPKNKKELENCSCKPNLACCLIAREIRMDVVFLSIWEKLK